MGGVGVEAPAVLYAFVIRVGFPSFQTARVRQVVGDGLDRGRTRFEQRLNHGFIFSRVVRARGINQGAAGDEQIISSEQQLPLYIRQVPR